MKQHLSVFAWAARSTVIKVLAILAAMTAVEAAFIYFYFNQIISEENFYGSISGMVSESRIRLIFGIAFVLICFLLLTTGSELFKSKVRYTLQRLSVSETAVVLWQTAYNAIVFLTMWALQLAVMLIASKMYMEIADPASTSEQSIFIAFYKDGFLHSLLPLDETSRYVRNILLLLAISISIAYFNYNQRNDKKSIAIFIIVSITVKCFSRELSSFGMDMVISIISLIAIVNSLYGVIKGEKNESETAF